MKRIFSLLLWTVFLVPLFLTTSCNQTSKEGKQKYSAREVYSTPPYRIVISVVIF